MTAGHGNLYDSALLCVQDIKRLLFNFLRISPSYWSVCSNPHKLRLHKHMPDEQRNAVLCFRRYGDVFSKSYVGWSNLHPRLFAAHCAPAVALCREPAVTRDKSPRRWLILERHLSEHEVTAGRFVGFDEGVHDN